MKNRKGLSVSCLRLGGSFGRERGRGFGFGDSESKRVESKFLRGSDEV